MLYIFGLTKSVSNFVSSLFDNGHNEVKKLRNADKFEIVKNEKNNKVTKAWKYENVKVCDKNMFSFNGEAVLLNTNDVNNYLKAKKTRYDYKKLDLMFNQVVKTKNDYKIQYQNEMFINCYSGNKAILYNSKDEYTVLDENVYKAIKELNCSIYGKKNLKGSLYMIVDQNKKIIGTGMKSRIDMRVLRDIEKLF